MTIMLTGSTRIFPVVGDPIEQVKSPAVMSTLFQSRGHNAVVVPIHVETQNLNRTVDTFKSIRNLDGILVTIPHKPAALSLCHAVSPRARFVGAVNVMRKSPDGWIGDNTDGEGFVNGIEAAGRTVRNSTVLLVGCGGAGAAIALEFLERGAANIAIHDINIERRDLVVGKLSDRFPGQVMTGSADPTGFDIVANATPMGMRPDDTLPVRVDALTPNQFVACVITSSEESPFVTYARERGCPAMNGTGMFVAQSETLADFLLFSEDQAPPSKRCA